MRAQTLKPDRTTGRGGRGLHEGVKKRGRKYKETKDSGGTRSKSDSL